MAYWAPTGRRACAILRGACSRSVVVSRGSALYVRAPSVKVRRRIFFSDGDPPRIASWVRSRVSPPTVDQRSSALDAARRKAVHRRESRCALAPHPPFAYLLSLGRGGQIRTADLTDPNRARYQTALRPERAPEDVPKLSSCQAKAVI